MLSRIVWRCNPVVIGFRKHKMFHQSTCFMDKEIVNGELHKFPSTATKYDNDSMTTAIKSSTNSYELLNVISKNVKHFSAEQTLTALNTLFELQKHTTTSINRNDIAKNTDFERLCRSLKRNARHMGLNDVIDALKIISFVGTSSRSEITMSLLHLIKDQINDVTLGHLIFLDFLLRRMDRNALVDTLQLALPVLLQIQIGTKIDYDNVTQLTELLSFVSRYRVNDQCIMNIVNALTLHGADLNLEQARSIVWSLSSSSLRIHNANSDKLLENAIRVMKRDFDKEDFTVLCTTLEKMINKYMYNPSTYEKFYDETLYNKCGDFVVTNDLGFENATFIQRQMNKLGFVHIKLLKYMLREVEKYPGLVMEAKTANLVSLVTALSQANYKPDNWNKIQSLILQSNLLTNEKRLTIPWTKLSIELLSLGIECPSIWDKVFSNQFLQIELARDRNKRLLRMLELHQHVKMISSYNIDNRIDESYVNEAKKFALSIADHPMQQHLESAFGGSSFVYTKVRTKLGHVIDHVIAFDKETMDPIPITDGRNHDVFYEDITTDDVTKQYIAVVAFPRFCYCINIPILRGIYELKLRTFEKMGMTVVVMNHSTWNELLDHEKIPYIQREVKLKLTQRRSVLEECQ